jgi:hypothetical protein
MAELNDVYGTNYQDESKNAKINHILSTITNNIAHRNFNFRVFDSSELWDMSQNMSQSTINVLINKVKNINKHMHLEYLDKKSDRINMLPELITDTPVEYFLVIDGEVHRAYFIYITPREVNAY